jgi:GH25 family lysozyme M1 (1,4-beta-N-acetylmuramidase)
LASPLVADPAQEANLPTMFERHRSRRAAPAARRTMSPPRQGGHPQRRARRRSGTGAGRAVGAKTLVAAAGALLIGTVFQATPASAHQAQSAGARAPAAGAPARLTALSQSATTARAAAVTALAREARGAVARLALTASAAHAGSSETVSHPAGDTLGAGGPRGTGAAATAGSAPRSAAVAAPGGILGVDVAGYQGQVGWSALASRGVQFAYVKATEGTYYVDSSYFPQQYNGSYDVGLIRGAYHFAVPNNSTGAAQADFFVANGGGWSADGHTLPGMLDLEYNPYGVACYGLNHGQMTNWVTSFDSEYKRLTGRLPDIYTSASWWNYCTGGNPVASYAPLTVANWGSSPYPLPGGWASYRIWQYTDSNSFGVDGDVFNGSRALLVAFAEGHARS